MKLLPYKSIDLTLPEWFVLNKTASSNASPYGITEIEVMGAINSLIARELIELPSHSNCLLIVSYQLTPKGREAIRELRNEDIDLAMKSGF